MGLDWMLNMSIVCDSWRDAFLFFHCRRLVSRGACVRRKRNRWLIWRKTTAFHNYRGQRKSGRSHPYKRFLNLTLQSRNDSPTSTSLQFFFSVRSWRQLRNVKTHNPQIWNAQLWKYGVDLQVVWYDFNCDGCTYFFRSLQRVFKLKEVVLTLVLQALESLRIWEVQRS